jgi:CheY-like chemotaxis protein
VRGASDPPSLVGASVRPIGSKPRWPRVGLKLRVLVAGANPMVLAMYREVLWGLGHTPVVAKTRQEALEVLRRERPALVIVDLLADEIDGPGICRHIRTSPCGNEIYLVVIVASQVNGAITPSVLDTGADDFILTPVTPEQVETRIRLAVRNVQQRMARREAERALVHAQWLAGIGETSLALQHEINNPLTAIIGSATLLETGEYSRDEELEFIRTIIEHAHRIGDVVRRLALLQNPRSVAYVRGTKMLDLSGHEKQGEK